MAQNQSGGSAAPTSGGNGSKGSSSGGKGGSSKGGGSKQSAGGSGRDPIETLAGKVPSVKADRAQSGKVDTKGKWANFPGGLKAFQGR